MPRSGVKTAGWEKYTVCNVMRGIGLFGRSVGILLRSPRLLLIGALPVVTALLLSGMGA